MHIKLDTKISQTYELKMQLKTYEKRKTAIQSKQIKTAHMELS